MLAAMVSATYSARHQCLIHIYYDSVYIAYGLTWYLVRLSTHCMKTLHTHSPGFLVSPLHN